MTSAILLLPDEDYQSVAEGLQTSGGHPLTIVLSDGSYLEFGAEHVAQTLSVAAGEEAIEVAGTKALTIHGAARIMPMPAPEEKP